MNCTRTGGSVVVYGCLKYSLEKGGADPVTM